MTCGSKFLSLPSLSAIALVSALTMGAPATAQDVGTTQGDIVVTALKREQRLQDVGATIEAFTGAELAEAGVTQAQDLEFSIPGLQFGNAGVDGSKISVRGVSSVRAYTGDDSATAVHINGVFLPYSGLALATLFDVQRVEVLKGPQGTLYGRNATAGAINIITTPAGNRLEGFGEVSYGSFNTVRANAALNVPLADNQAVRIAGTFARGDGYIRNTLDNRRFGNENSWGARLSYHGDFGGVRADLRAEYMRDDGKTSVGGVVPVSSVPSTAGIAIKRGFYDTVYDAVDDREEKRTVYVSGTLEADLSDVIKLRSITGYTNYKTDIRGDAANLFNPAELGIAATPRYGQAYVTQDGYSLSQEINLLGSIGTAVDFTVGGFFVHQQVVETRFGDNRGAPPQAPLSNLDDFYLRQTGNALGVFADVTGHLTSGLRVIGGVRYNWEEKTQRQEQTTFIAGLGIPAPLSFADQLTASYANPTYRAGVEYDLSRDNLLYLTYSRGFRSGAIGGLVGLDNFFDVAFGGPGQLGLKKLKPEIADAFEFGSKNSFLNGRITINVAGFYSQYRDQLFFQFDPITFQLIEGNIGKSRFWGADVSIDAQVSQAFKVSFAGEYLNTRVIDTGPGSAGVGVSPGNRLPYAPELSFTLAGDYRIPIGTSVLTLRGELGYKSDTFFDLGNNIRQDDVTLINASVRFESGKGWYGFVTGRNLGGAEYFVSGGIPSNALAGSLQSARPGTPRQIFGGFGVKF